MTLVNKDLLMKAGIAANAVRIVEDELCAVGNAARASGGGSSLNPTGNIFNYLSTTGTGNGADTTEDTLQTTTLPASALDSVGRGIWMYAWGSYANNTNTKAAKLYFGTTNIAAATGNNTGWALEMIVMKAGASTQVISAQNITGSTHGGVTNSTSSAATDTAAITLKVTGQNSTSATANSIVLNGWFVCFMN